MKNVTLFLASLSLMATALCGCPELEDEDWPGFDETATDPATDSADPDTGPPDTHVGQTDDPTAPPDTETVSTYPEPDYDTDNLMEVAEEFPIVGGCGDLYLYACNEDQTVRLTFSRAEGLIGQACEHGGYAGVELFSLPENNLRVELTSGRNLCRNECNDYIDETDVVELRTFYAVDGVGQIDVAPVTPGCAGGADTSSRANLWLSGVVLVSHGKDQALALPEMSFTNVLVGWLPG